MGLLPDYRIQLRSAFCLSELQLWLDLQGSTIHITPVALYHGGDIYHATSLSSSLAGYSATGMPYWLSTSMNARFE